MSSLATLQPLDLRALTASVGALEDADLASESERLASLQNRQAQAQPCLAAHRQPHSLLTLFQH